MLMKVKICKNRLVEKGLHLVYPDIFSKLNMIGNPQKDAKSDEHMQLQAGFLTMLTEAL